MRALFLALCLVCLAGCTRSASATHEPVATLEAPAATVAPPPAPVVLGEDENGNVVDQTAIAAIEAALKNDDPAVRRAAVKRLGRIRWKLPEPVGAILKQALADADAETRIEAVYAAAADPLRTPDVARMLHDPSRRVQVVAARVLIAQGKHEADAYPVLSAAFADRNAPDRDAILDLLRMKAPASRAALPVLVALSLDAHEPLRLHTIDAVSRFGPAQEALDALLQIAHDADPKVRAAAVRALGKLDPQSAKVQVSLRKALRDPQVDVALAATEAVGARAIPLLIEHLRSGDERVRDASARALGRLGPEAWSAVPELQRLAQSDPVVRVRQTAAVAIKAIVPPL